MIWPLTLPPWAFWTLIAAFVLGSLRLSNWLWEQECREDEQRVREERLRARPGAKVIDARERFRARREQVTELARGVR